MDILVGLWPVLGFALGYFAGLRTRKAKAPAPEVCQCKHGPERHDKDGCHAEVNGPTVREWSHNINRIPLSWVQVPCTCVRYVGPHTSYIPELDSQ